MNQQHGHRDQRHSSCQHTQLLGAGQEALLEGEDVVEDEELGGDGVALPHAAAAALPLLAANSGTKQDAT